MATKKQTEEKVHPLDPTAITRTASMVEILGISAVHCNRLAKDGVLKVKKPGVFYVVTSVKNYINHVRQGNRTKDGLTENSQGLRDALVREQARKEKAVASLKELQLRMEEHNLVPESEVCEKLTRILTPLRRLLDALPRACSAQANPGKPMVAEHAIRHALDDRVFGELAKIIDTMEQEEEHQPKDTQ